LTRRHLTAACALAAATLVTGAAGLLVAQAPAPPAGYTVVSRDGRRPLAVRSIGGQEMFALDDLARLFGLSLREDPAAGGLTVSAGSQTIVLSPGQPLASVGGRLISLPSAPVHQGRAWFVPVDFVPRALGPALGTRVELRRPSRLVLVGDVRLPQITVRIEPVGTEARVTFDVAPATPHVVSQEGNRIVVRFTAEAIDPTIPASPVPDLVQSVHPGDAPASLAVDLGPRFGSFRTADTAGDRGAGRVTLDIAPQVTQSTQAPQAAAPLPAAPEPPPLVDFSPSGALRTIVVDAGHGGDDAGARGAGGTLEKNVTLGVARRLEAALESRLGVRVILTRDGDRNVGLDERASLANNNKADLFISLHANASVRESMSGAEIFYLSLQDYGEEGQRAAHETEPVPVFGGGMRDIEVTLWEMAQARYIDRSAALAAAAEGALRERVAMSPRALQQAPLRVLVGANMPAILVEMAFLTNEKQEHDVSTEAFQNGIVQGLVEAIVRYRDSGAGRTTGAAVPLPAAAGSGGTG
jgi:N-acetylmuramoyl-L-alanine amidase